MNQESDVIELPLDDEIGVNDLGLPTSDTVPEKDQTVADETPERIEEDERIPFPAAVGLSVDPSQSTVTVLPEQRAFAEFAFNLELDNGGRLSMPTILKYDRHADEEVLTEVQGGRLMYFDANGHEEEQVSQDLREHIATVIAEHGQPQHDNVEFWVESHFAGEWGYAQNAAKATSLFVRLGDSLTKAKNSRLLRGSCRRSGENTKALPT